MTTRWNESDERFDHLGSGHLITSRRPQDVHTERMAHDPPQSAVRADPANADQLRNWDGDGGAYWADNATRYDEGVAAYRPHFLAATAISGADVVLDIGCGAGQTTRDAARAAPDGTALGVDLSSRMLEVARREAGREGLTNATFRQADAQTHPFAPGSFDVAISRTGTLFFGDAPAAFTRIARALRPEGRLVLMAWQPLARQQWLRGYFAALSAGRGLAPPPSGAPGPFAFAEPDHVRHVLSGAGFTDVALTGVRRPMYAGPDAADATRFVLGQFGGMLEGLDERGRTRAVDDLHATMAAHAVEDGVLFDSAIWLVEARRG